MSTVMGAIVWQWRWQEWFHLSTPFVCQCLQQ